MRPSLVGLLASAILTAGCAGSAWRGEELPPAPGSTRMLVCVPAIGLGTFCNTADVQQVGPSNLGEFSEPHAWPGR